MRRLRAAEPVAPGALSRLIAALGLPPERAARLRSDPRFVVFETGGLAPRAAVAALRKRLIAAQLPARLDHRSGPYRAASSAARRAVSREFSAGRAAGGLIGNP